MARTNGSEHLRYRYGICLNDQCSKCKSKEVQTILARKDFVCEECGKQLRECPPPVSFWGKYGKIIIIAGVVVIAAIVGVVIALSSSSSSENSDKTEIEKNESQTKADSTKVVEPAKLDTVTPKTSVPQTGTAQTSVENTPDKRPTPQEPTPTPAGPKVSYGKYQGPVNGMGGVITVTRSYSLDLRTGTGESIDLQPGDQIQNTRFKDGDLREGVWVHGSERKHFNR